MKKKKKIEKKKINMNSNINKILIGIIIILIVLLISDIITKMEKHYKYLTYNEIWGESSKCFIDENQITFCKENDNNYIKVKQYYTQS